MVSGGWTEDSESEGRASSRWGCICDNFSFVNDFYSYSLKANTLHLLENHEEMYYIHSDICSVFITETTQKCATSLKGTMRVSFIWICTSHNTHNSQWIFFLLYMLPSVFIILTGHDRFPVL